MKTLWLRLALALGMLIGGSGAAAGAARLNVIVILVDDLGAHDLGCGGSTFHRTPNIDRLAAQGTRFTAAYSACTVCSPTRASLLTGQYPARLHLTDWISGHTRPYAKLRVPDWTQHLERSEVNLARVFHQAGYATAAIGKWHLGGPEYYPDRQGFDVNIGGTDRGQPPSYHAPYRIATLPEGPPGEFLTDRESAEACAFIEKNQHRPFFLYLAHYGVHTPLMGKAQVIERYRTQANPAAPQHNPTYAALLESVDDSVGRLRAKLEELHLAEQTLVIFTSDNGGLILGGTNAPTSNAPLRSGKGSPYEGGVRVPLVACWPGHIPAGKLCAVPTITPDLYPTVLNLAGVEDFPGHRPDGQSLAAVLLGRPETASARRAPLYWHYPHYHPGGATPYGAIRQADWKLIQYDEDGHCELFDLAHDPGEQRDLCRAKARVAAQLRQKLAQWRQKVGAQMPAPNPQHDPARDR